jgi:RHS repeat-associated protein
VVTTTYVNQYVYQSIGTGADQLSFMLFEEGRIRVVHPVAWNNGYDTYGMFGNLSLPDGKQGVYDYFVTDHQQNVRMILSEEVQYASNTATMESSRSSQEEPVFGRSGAGNELAASRYATPSGWQNASVGAQVSRLGSLSGNMVGPNTLQKVMAGDQMSATVQYFFESAPGNSTPLTTMLLNTLGQLLSTGSQVGGLVKGNASAVTSQLSANPGFVNAVNPAQGGANTPQAYLTMVFFDERFEPIAEADGGVVRQQVAQSVGSGGSTLGLGNIKAPRNGYVLVYVSNSSEQPVYFDNLQVGKVNGNILEENHYYSFGLRISAISSRRFTDQYQGETKNGYLYQGAFAELDDDIGWQDFALRSYDAQIGRFMQMDPFSQFASHYTGMGNDPVNMIDPSGGIGIVTPCPGSSLFLANIGNAISNVASALSSISPIVGYASSGLRTAAAVNNNVTQFNTVNRMMSVSMTSRVGFLPEGDKNGNRQDDFAPLTKTIFEDFVKNTRCRNCGKGTLQNTTGLYFQELFEEYIEENFNLAGFRVVSDPANNRLPGDFRSTVPDYFGMKYSLRDGRPIEITTFYELESFFELKATKNNIGLSSFEGQLQVQIQAARRLRVQEIVVVTTHGVRLTEPLKNYATGQGVRLTHYWAEYKILENNRMILNFVLAKYK